MRCKFCNSTRVIDHHSVKSAYNGKSIYTLYECQNCASQFFDFQQYNISINDMYETLANEKVNLIAQFSPRQYWIDQQKIILKILNRKPQSILDIGCRTGDFLMHFDKDIKREGVEISKACAEIADKRGLQVYNQNIEDLKLARSYDIVTAYNILEHLINPKQFLEKISSVVSKDGVLAILIPTHECLKVKAIEKIGKKWHMYIPPEHLNFFSKAFLDLFMQYQGFKLAKRYYSSGGLFNPFKGIMLLNWGFSKFMYYFDKLIFNQLPVFDHIFSYYKKV